MSGLNKVLIIGNVGQDPDIRYTKDNKPIANLSIATSETWKDQSGQKQEKTEWHKIVIFGALADIVSQYVHKGSKLYIEGKLQTQKWQDKNGNDRYTTEVIVQGFGGTLLMLDSKGNVSPDQPQQNQAQPQQQQNFQQNNQPQQQNNQNFQQQPQQQQNNQNFQQRPQQQNNQNFQQQQNQPMDDEYIPF